MNDALALIQNAYGCFGRGDIPALLALTTPDIDWQFHGDRGAGYYSLTLGNWHIIALNSNVPSTVGSPQYQWLNNDLRGSTAK